MQPGNLLAGRKALVTGAQQGIGKGIAIEFARQGADVAINYLDDALAAEAVAEEVRALGRKAVTIQADVADFARIPDWVGKADAALGGIDIVANNAGIYPRVNFLELTEEAWDRTLDVNLKASVFVAQAAAKRMVAAGRGGAIVSIASLAVHGFPNSVHYSASKAGVVGMTRAMAFDLARHDIRVNAIAPGLTDTAQPRGGYTERQLVEMANGLLIARMGRPDEIGAVAVFLASEMSAFMTGQTVHVNGGAMMR